MYSGSETWNILSFCSQAVVPIGVSETGSEWRSTERLGGLFVFSEILRSVTGLLIILCIKTRNPENVQAMSVGILQ